MLALLVLHRAKLLASAQSILALGVAPMRVVSRWCRCICALTAICAVASCNGIVWLSLCVLAYRLCATDCKRPCLVRAAAPHSAPARMPGVYAQRLCTMQSQQSIRSLSLGKGGRGIGIINQKFISKTGFSIILGAVFAAPFDFPATLHTSLTVRYTAFNCVFVILSKITLKIHIIHQENLLKNLQRKALNLNRK